MRKPIYAVKAKHRKLSEWGSWTGEFDTEAEAVDHMKQHFNDPCFTDRLEFAVFLKDSDEQTRLIRSVL